MLLVGHAVGSEPSKIHKVKLNGQTFTLPVGFTIELVAGPPLIERPIHADFDDQGILYVADSSGSNEAVEVQLAKKPHRIVRLKDSDGDGKFDQSTVYADRMMFPAGAMWLDGSLYVAAPPSIWKLTDTNGDGIAEKREEWFKGKTLTGCANDLHGPFAGPDGWIYWCKGAFAKQEYERPGKPFITRAAHIFRARRDGSGVEAVMTGGMDNPVELVFTPGGERIFSTTFFQRPAQGKRDGLVHAVYGGVYGKENDVTLDHPWTSPSLMPVMTHMGAAAPAGLMRYESETFGPEYRDNLFCAQFNLRKVSRHVLVPDGATFKTIDSDFLVSDNFDFHPTDVLEDADGSLLVIDTGGWYKLCCPSSVLAKADVLGAIYRIRKTDAKPIDDPRGLKIEWKALSVGDAAALLGDPRPIVRKRTIDRLAELGEQSIRTLHEVITNSKSSEVRRNAVWALTRITDMNGRIIAFQGLRDADETVRQTAAHTFAVQRDVYGPAIRLGDHLSKLSMMNRRAIAEAIGRVGNKEESPDLLKQLENENDRVTEHSLIYALIEIGDAASVAKGLESENATVRRAALTALDQMNGKQLRAEQVTKELNAKDDKLRSVAWWIASRHPEWGNDVAGVLRERLIARPIVEPAELERHLATFAGSKSIQKLMADLAVSHNAETRAILFSAMRAVRLKQTPTAWIDMVTAALDLDDEVWPHAVETVRSLKLTTDQAKQLASALRTIGESDREGSKRRLALAAIPGGLKNVSAPLLSFLQDGLKSEDASSLSATILASAKLDSAQLIALAESFKTVGPMEIDRLLDAYASAKDPAVGNALLEALTASPLRTSLRIDRLTPIFTQCQTDANTLYAMIDADAEKQKAKLKEMLPKLAGGDIRRGQAVYLSPKVQCAACHAMGYQGGKIGPDLTHIGKIRSEADLLESILFPSATLVRSFEPVKLVLNSGAVHSGLIQSENAGEVVLQLTVDQQMRIRREDIETMLPGKISIMPAGLDQQLTVQELGDLIAFLKAQQ